LADKATPTAFLSVHFLLAVQKKVSKRFYSLSGRSERKCEGIEIFKDDICECRLWNRYNPLFCYKNLNNNGKINRRFL